VWAKISNSATKMACAACLVVAATLPAAGSAAEHIRDENLRLSAFTDVDAFSAIPLYLQLLDPATRNAAIAGLDSINGIPGLLALLGGDVNQLLPDGNPGYAALSALQVFFGTAGVFGTGGIGALSDYDALSAIPAYQTLLDPTSTPENRLLALGSLDSVSAIPVFVAFANADTPQHAADALGGYDALSAVKTFFGTDGVFTGGGINALAPAADGSGGYAALSALPVFFGTDPAAPFGLGVFTNGGIGALSNYDALSAIPAYLTPPTTMAAPFAAANAGPQAKIAEDPAPTTTAPPTGSNPVKTFVASLPKLPDFTPPAPQAFTPSAPPKEEPKIEEAAATPGDNSGSNQQNVVRDSTKATPTERLGGDSSSPFWLQNGGAGVDNGIRGWGDALKKMGIGGGDSGGGGSTP
jgi:hypothetical protein